MGGGGGVKRKGGRGEERRDKGEEDTHLFDPLNGILKEVQHHHVSKTDWMGN